MTLKEEQSITRPPLLEGSNYATWKPVMRSFLKSLDEKGMEGYSERVDETHDEQSHWRTDRQTRSSVDRRGGQSFHGKLKGNERNFLSSR
ncbi:unnamed protein product [Rhodiola kirilowii]